MYSFVLDIMEAYKWLICYLLKISSEKLECLTQQGVDAFTAKNNTQIYFLRTLSIVYIEVNNCIILVVLMIV